jgi:hypothetical protein
MIFTPAEYFIKVVSAYPVYGCFIILKLDETQIYIASPLKINK